MSDTWFLKNDKTVKRFNSFDDAVKSFRKAISNHISNNEDAYSNDNIPFSIGVYFSGKYDSESVSDGEIVICERTSLLLSAFNWDNAERAQFDAEKSISKDYSFSGVDEFNNNIRIILLKKSDEIIAELTSDDNGNETSLRTNAFIFKNKNKRYYFISKQIITTTSRPELLGKVVEANIELFNYQED